MKQRDCGVHAPNFEPRTGPKGPSPARARYYAATGHSAAARETATNDDVLRSLHFRRPRPDSRPPPHNHLRVVAEPPGRNRPTAADPVSSRARARPGALLLRFQNRTSAVLRPVEFHRPLHRTRKPHALPADSSA